MPTSAAVQRFISTLVSSRVRVVALALVAVVATVAGAVTFAVTHRRPGSVYHQNQPFVAESDDVPVAAKGAVQWASWPAYGLTAAHTRDWVGPTPGDSLRTAWSRHGSGALLEFPPVLWHNKLVVMDDSGTLTAINRNTGHTFWQHRFGTLAASSPAVGGDGPLVFADVLDRSTNDKRGAVAAFDVSTGAELWQRDLPDPTESSPLLDDGKLFLGSQDGTMYALDPTTGRILWRYHAAGPIKASPSADRGRLFFGDYGGAMQAVSERTGRQIWSSGSGGALEAGQFYATAAVAHGRVYAGNTDGRVYCYDEDTGRLDWAVQTGAYVYSSPAVADAPGLGPTVFIGSYDGKERAIDARTGAIRWAYNAKGRISGPSVVMGDRVYFSDLGTQRTYGLTLRTGKVEFTWSPGYFDPGITDGHTLYLNGISSITALTDLAAAG